MLEPSRAAKGLWMEITQEKDEAPEADYEDAEYGIPSSLYTTEIDATQDAPKASYKRLNIEGNNRAELKKFQAQKIVKCNETMGIVLVVPDRDMGRLIGKGGKFISMIRERSGAKIQAQDRKLFFRGPGFGNGAPQRLFKAFGSEEALRKVIYEVARKLSTLRIERACDIVILCPLEDLSQMVRSFQNVTVIDQRDFALVVIEGYLNIVSEVSNKVLATGIAHHKIDESKLKTYRGTENKERRQPPVQSRRNFQPRAFVPQLNPYGVQANPYGVAQNQYFAANPHQNAQQLQHQPRQRKRRRPRDRGDRRSRSRSPEINQRDAKDFLHLLNTLMGSEKNGL